MEKTDKIVAFTNIKDMFALIFFHSKQTFAINENQVINIYYIYVIKEILLGQFQLYFMKTSKQMLNNWEIEQREKQIHQGYSM